MKAVYFISGLGADERVFQLLQLTGCKVHYVHWITPEKDEPMQQYANRLLTQIKEPNPILVGLSFGGMMAVEIDKIIPVKKIILISSAKHHKELPFYFQFLRIIKIHQWIPFPLLQKMGLLLGDWLFGTENKSTSLMLKSIIHDTDEKYFRWAWEKVIHWDNKIIPPHLTHIHGNKDHMLPGLFVKPNIIIPGGTHLQIVNKAGEIGLLLQQLIDQCAD
jgi:pimeloyl-ACP methyl ester carboxylesterase